MRTKAKIPKLPERSCEMKSNLFKNVLKKSGDNGAERRLDDDYEIENGRHSVIIAIVSLICALVIWLYAISTGNIIIP